MKNRIMRNINGKMLAALALGLSVFASACGGSADAPSGGSDASPADETQTELSEGAQPADDIFINSEWSCGQVSIGGGGFVTGIIPTCESGVFYARTDVGGAYRWDKEADRWISLSCFVTEDDVGLLGIDGIASDPQRASKVILAAGTEYFSGGRTCIMVSENYGETFTQVDVTDMIRLHGNGMGRGNGERIAIDPNDGNIVFCGGRTGGLIRSSDGGYTWEKVDFPVSSTSNGNGINVILFDPSSGSDGKASRKIYAAVSDKKTDNIFVSEDGGTSWSPLTGAVTDYMPQRMKLDSQGRLYVTYANNEGPWNASRGSLLRYDTAAGTCEDISPIVFSMGDVAISPDDDNRLVCVTTEKWEEQPNGAYGDRFYISQDGGKSWTDVMPYSAMNSNGIDWISDYAIHWCSSLAMDPFDDNKILVNSGNGIFACENIWDDTPEFYFDARGIEEVVPLDIVSVPGQPLLSAIGDYDGFVHEDIFSSAERYTETVGTCSGIAAAPLNPDVLVRTGGDDKEQKLLYTEDGGKSWKYITNKPDEGKVFFQGYVALTADGGTIIWSPSNSNYAYYTDDRGESWNKCEGLLGSGAYVVGDPVNPDYVYACANSTVFVSADGGKTFSRKFDTMGSFTRISVVYGEEGKFYVPGAALFFTEDHGENFTVVNGLKRSEAVGIGKGRTDSDPYVIYVWGIPKDSETKGIYMSEDLGETWVRANDDLHNFGGTGNGRFVCGDMNVYGRCYMSTVGLGIAYCDKNEK